MKRNYVTVLSLAGVLAFGTLTGCGSTGKATDNNQLSFAESIGKDSESTGEDSPGGKETDPAADDNSVASLDSMESATDAGASSDLYEAFKAGQARVKYRGT